MDNQMEIYFDAKTVNEAFARLSVVAFMSELDPTVEEIEDVRMAVSEAVTNAIIHGYKGGSDRQVRLWCGYRDKLLRIEVGDEGVGIDDVHKAMQPFFTSEEGEERAGMGFAFMSAFMDSLEVDSKPGKGTVIKMTKGIGSGRQ